MEIGQPVAKAGAQMKQHRGGPARDACIAVGRTGGDALKEGQHAAHLGNGVQGRDEVHLGRAGVGEADVDTAVDQGIDQSLRTIHERSLAVMSREVVPFGIGEPV